MREDHCSADSWRFGSRGQGQRHVFLWSHLNRQVRQLGGVGKIYRKGRSMDVGVTSDAERPNVSTSFAFCAEWDSQETACTPI